MGLWLLLLLFCFLILLVVWFIWKYKPSLLLEGYKDQQVKRLRNANLVPGYLYQFEDGSGNIIYVGKSSNPSRRLNEHIRLALADSEFYSWLRDEIHNGRKPIMRVMARYETQSELAHAEKRTIEEYVQNGVALLNRQYNPQATKSAQYVVMHALIESPNKNGNEEF